MNAPLPSSHTQSLESPQPAKCIADLDSLLAAILSSLPSAKPWQRQLRGYLRESDRQLQVVRLTVVMKRADTEVLEAANDLLQSMRSARGYVTAGRADMGTKMAVQLAASLAEQLQSFVRSR